MALVGRGSCRHVFCELLPLVRQIQFLPARAKAISSSGGNSGELYVRKLCCSCEQMWEKEQIPRPIWRRKKRCSRHRSRGPQQPREKTMAKQVMPWSPQSISVEQISTLKIKEDLMPQRVNVPQKKLHLRERSCWISFWQDMKCSPGRGAHTGAGFLTGILTPWGNEPSIIHSLKTATHGMDPCWGSTTMESHERDYMEQGNSVMKKVLKKWSVMSWPQTSFLKLLQHSGGRIQKNQNWSWA